MLLLLAHMGCSQSSEDPAALDPNAPPAELERPDCSAYESSRIEWDCTVLDRCDTSTDNLLFRNACCNCDPRLCRPDPDCPDDGVPRLR